MVELGQDDLVTGLQRLPKRAAEREGERGHVGPKIHLFAVLGVEHVGHPFVRRHNNGVGFVAGHELPVCVGIRAGEVFDDAVDTGLRHLGAGGAVEENDGAAMLQAGQGREVWADLGDVEHRGELYLGWGGAQYISVGLMRIKKFLPQSTQRSQRRGMKLV